MMWESLANAIIGGVLTGLVYSLMALGLSVIFGVIKVVNFAHGEMMTVAMFAGVMLFTGYQVDPLIALIPVAAVIGFIGYGLQRSLINSFVGRPDHEQFILLLAVGIIIVNGLLMAFGPGARAAIVSYAFDSFAVGPLIIDAVKVYVGLVVILISAALLLFFRYTRQGKAIRACADNLVGAQVVGLDVKHLYALTFGIGAACVGAAGCLLSLVVEVTPMAGPELTLLAFIIVIIGGLGSMSGALLGGVLIGFSESLAGFLIVPSLKSLFSYGLLIFVLLLRPQGLLGRKAS